MTKAAKLTAYRQRVAAERAQRLEDLAELVAEGLTVQAACMCLGFSQSAGARMWRDICDGLGERTR